MDTLLPIVSFFLFFLGGGLFNVKFKLFFIVFSAISNIFLKRLRRGSKSTKLSPATLTA